VTVGPVDRDEATAEFFDGAAAGQFLLRHCPDGHHSEPAAVQCTTCGSMQLRWVPASGGATLVSWAVTWDKPDPEAEPAAAVLVIAELDEGPWWWSRLVDAEPDSLTAGTRLAISFRAGGSEQVPVFELGGYDPEPGSAGG
jgi:uncharacterized OB-fold protein